MKSHAPYYDSLTGTNRVIAIDDDGYYFNVVPDAGSIENAKEIASALDSVR